MRKFFILATGTVLSLTVASNALAPHCHPDVILVPGPTASPNPDKPVPKLAGARARPRVWP